MEPIRGSELGMKDLDCLDGEVAVAQALRVAHEWTAGEQATLCVERVRDASWHVPTLWHPRGPT